jgi:TPR repeat protein
MGLAAGATGLDAAVQCEAHYRRLCRLQQMGAGELRRLLAGSIEDAAPWIESAARAGVAEAQLRLGQMLLDGAGVPLDARSALDWFLRAAAQGAPESMNMAGRCHENGWGAPVDLPAAAQWYRLAAEAGLDWGQYNYANLLFDGRGLPRDRRQALIWYRRAAEQGHARAMNLLARCYEEGWGARRDGRKAMDWYRRAAEGGYFRAQYNVATLLAGQGKVEEALTWFDKACRAATPDSLPGMVKALAAHQDPKLAELGRRLGRAPTA